MVALCSLLPRLFILTTLPPSDKNFVTFSSPQHSGWFRRDSFTVVLNQTENARKCN